MVDPRPDGLEMRGPPGAVDLFQAGELPLDLLGDMCFRLDDRIWTRHPQVVFVEQPILPSVRMPGVDLVWQQILFDSPCGEIPVAHRFVGGVRVEAHLGRLPDPTVTTRMRYSAVLRLMAGAWSMLQAFERGGHIDGDWSKMLLLSGVCDSFEFTEAMRFAAGGIALALADLADG